MTGSEAVARGRAACERQAWAEAFRELTLAGREIVLEPEDLDRLATAATWSVKRRSARRHALVPTRALSKEVS